MPGFSNQGEEPHILDNLCWHALNSHQANFAIGNGLAKRFRPDVSPLAALAECTDAALEDLAQIVSDGESVFVDHIEIPAQMPAGIWKTVHTFTLMQLVSKGPIADISINQEVLDLTISDVPDMLQLAELTQPGPFRIHTIELGHYIGIRQHGTLIAMAGERRHLPGYREISAVCTHPDHRGRGPRPLDAPRKGADQPDRIHRRRRAA